MKNLNDDFSHNSHNNMTVEIDSQNDDTQNKKSEL